MEVRSESGVDIKDVCFIAAKEKHDFIYDAIKDYGFNIMIPYKDTDLIFRILREIWFRLKLSNRKIWFNPAIKTIKEPVIIVKDSLVCTELLKYIKHCHPNAKLVVMYFNRVHTTFPATEASKYADELWSYDEDDCSKYHMKKMSDYYFQGYKVERKESPDYDVVYLGRDKGRGEDILKLEKRFNELGLRTYFHITPDRSFQRYKKSYYKPVIPYREYTKLLSNTKALLNIMPEGQRSITPRDMEVIFDGVKGITNNLGIKDFKFYHPDRYFVLGERPLEELKSFLETPFPAVAESELQDLEFDRMVLNLLNNGNNLND